MRGSVAVWRLTEPNEAVSYSDDVEVETLTGEQLVTLLTNLLHARCFSLVYAVLDAVDASRWQEVAEIGPPGASPAVVAFLRERFAFATGNAPKGFDVSALKDQLINTPDDYLRELLVLELRGEPDKLEDLQFQLSTYRWQHHAVNGPELDALVEYTRQVGRLKGNEVPQCNLAWLRAAYAGRWSVTNSVFDGEQQCGGPDGKQQRGVRWPIGQPIGKLSLLALLGVVRDHLEHEMRMLEQTWTPKLRGQSWQRPLYLLKGPSGDDPGEFDALMTAIIEQSVILCRTQPLQTVAVVLTRVHEIANVGDVGRPWAEEFLAAVSPVLLDRLAESPPDELSAWDYAEILAAYGNLARFDDIARQVVEALTLRLNRGLAAKTFELRPPLRELHSERALAGCLVTLSQLPRPIAEAFDTFSLVQPLLAELLGLNTQSSMPFSGTRNELSQQLPEVVPESLTLTLTAYAQLLCRTTFEDLPVHVEQFILRLVERARMFVPKELGKFSSTPQLSRSQLVRITAALMQFRGPPRAVVELLGELSELTATALEGYITLDDLEAILNGYTSIVRSIPNLVVVYEAAISKLITLVKHPRPSVMVVRFVVLAYNRRDALLRQAEWYAREAERREWLASNVDGARQAREQGDALRTRGKVYLAELEALLLTTVTSVQQVLAAYSPSQQRRVLYELTKIKGLGASKNSSLWLEQNRSSVLGEIDQAVTAIFGQLSESRTMIGRLAEALTQHLAWILYAYSWLRIQQPSDAQLVKDLLEELEARAPRLSPSELTGMLSVLGKLRRPAPELTEFLEGMIERSR